MGSDVLWVDYRSGSHELLDPLRKMGLPAEETTLAFGDLAFIGRGDGGTPVDVGVEFKKLGECVTALRTNRLQGFQAPGMRETYDFCWLLVEGELLYNKRGQLMRRAGRRVLKRLPGQMTINELNKRLLGLHLRGGLNPWHTQNRVCTLKWIEALYRSWTDEDFDKHTSHLGIYRAASVVPISPFRTFIGGLPNVGLRVSKAAEKQFGSIRRAINAPVREWASLVLPDDSGKLRRFGEKDAQKLDNFLEAQS